jgi:hypothetical protein
MDAVKKPHQRATYKGKDQGKQDVGDNVAEKPEKQKSDDTTGNQQDTLGSAL